MSRLVGWLFVARVMYFLSVSPRLHAESAPDDVKTISFSIQLAEWSATLLMYGMYVPLVLPVYDSLIVPIVQKVWSAGDDPLAIALALMCAELDFKLAIIVVLNAHRTFAEHVRLHFDCRPMPAFTKRTALCEPRYAPSTPVACRSACIFVPFEIINIISAQSLGCCAEICCTILGELEGGIQETIIGVNGG